MDKITLQDWSAAPEAAIENVKLITRTTVQARQSIATALNCELEDIPLASAISSAREACSDVFLRGFNKTPAEIEASVHLIAEVTALTRHSLSEALGCDLTEVPIRSSIHCAIESIWDFEYKKSQERYELLTQACDGLKSPENRVW